MNVTISFSAGRRGAGSIDCIVCGVPIHQRVDPGASYDPTMPWYDGHGQTSDIGGTHPEVVRHDHAPAKEEGPTFGPFSYAELTYEMLRVDDGLVVAVWNAGRGDWVISDAMSEGAGEAYSDVAIFPTPV